MGSESVLNVVILTPERMIYEGTAQSLILPGEKGVFEILPYHKELLSRLVRGNLILDGHTFPIKRGVVKIVKNETVVIVEEQA
jgi:F-type H+-transporting ATPase subunit epsilon